MSQENVEFVRASLDGWSRGDADAWLKSAHPRVEFRPSGVYPGIDQTYRGHQGSWAEALEALGLSE